MKQVAVWIGAVLLGLNSMAGAATIEAFGTTFTTGGNANWFWNSSNESIQSGDISDSQTTWLQTIINGPCSVEVDMMVDSEEGWTSDDDLFFYLDGDKKAEIEGSFDHFTQVYVLGSGAHTFKWSYEKDWSTSEGQDCGWVKLNITQLSGSGTASDPWQINSVDDFKYFANNHLFWQAGTFTELRANLVFEPIDISNYELGREDIYGGGNAYAGNFDGKGYSIKGLQLDVRDVLEGAPNGVFGKISSSGTVKNLKIEECQISGLMDTGGLCGVNEGVISNCSVSGWVDCGAVPNYEIGFANSGEHCGGLVGRNEGGKIVRCESSANIIGEKYVGGLCGVNGANGVIRESFAAEKVIEPTTENQAEVFASEGNVQGEYAIGGICGGNNGLVQDCYSSVDLMGVATSFDGGEGTTITLAPEGLGGICAYNSSEGIISNCYSTTKIPKDADRVGYYDSGAICGSNNNSLFGLMGDGTIERCYWNETLSETSYSDGGGNNVSVSELSQSSTFSGWSFSSFGTTDSVWVMDGHPKLAWKYHVVALRSSEHARIKHPNSGDDYIMLVRDGDYIETPIEMDLTEGYVVEHIYAYKSISDMTEEEFAAVDWSYTWDNGTNNIGVEYYPLRSAFPSIPTRWADWEWNSYWEVWAEAYSVFPVYEDIDETAVCVKKRYHVEFDIGDHASRIGGGELVQVVEHGESPLYPEISVDAGYFFYGWTPEASGGVAGNVTIALLVDDDAEAANPAAFYQFESDGTDSSGNGNHAEVVGCTVNGVLVQSKSTAEYVKLPHTLFDGATGFSFSAFGKLNDLTTRFRHILSCAGSEHSNELLLGYDTTTENWFFHRRGVRTDFPKHTVFSDLGWHHVALSVSHPMHRLYVDGVLVASTNIALAPPLVVSTNAVFLGQDQDSIGGGFDADQAWHGEMDTVRIYNRVLSAAEIAEMAADFDGDGLSDAEEASLGTDPIDSDSDDDGMSDGDELIAGSNPNDADDYLKILGLSRNPSVEVRFRSSSNRMYTLLYCTNLTEKVWVPVESQSNVPGTGSETSLIDTDNTASRFYKIEVKQP